MSVVVAYQKAILPVGIPYFEPERLKGFLDSYFEVAKKPDDFDDKF